MFQTKTQEPEIAPNFVTSSSLFPIYDLFWNLLCRLGPPFDTMVLWDPFILNLSDDLHLHSYKFQLNYSKCHLHLHLHLYLHLYLNLNLHLHLHIHLLWPHMSLKFIIQTICTDARTSKIQLGMSLEYPIKMVWIVPMDPAKDLLDVAKSKTFPWKLYINLKQTKKIFTWKCKQVKTTFENNKKWFLHLY